MAFLAGCEDAGAGAAIQTRPDGDLLPRHDPFLGARLVADVEARINPLMIISKAAPVGMHLVDLSTNRACTTIIDVKISPQLSLSAADAFTQESA